MFFYTDTDAQHDQYHYQVVEFSKRAGEPIGYTVPRAIDNAAPEAIDYGEDVSVNANTVLIHHTPGAPLLQLIPCSSIDPTNNDFSQPLLFGGGIEMQIWRFLISIRTTRLRELAICRPLITAAWWPSSSYSKVSP